MKDKYGRLFAHIRRMAIHVLVRAGIVAGHVAGVPQPAISEERVEPSDLFSALDARELLVGGCRWCMEVFSVSEIGQRRYVQLALSGPTHHMLTLRATTASRSDDLARRLSAWLSDPGPTGAIVDLV